MSKHSARAVKPPRPDPRLYRTYHSDPPAPLTGGAVHGTLRGPKHITIMPIPHDVQLRTHLYLASAVQMIDNEFGEGYAKKNPHMVSRLVESQVLLESAYLDSDD